MSGKVTVGVCGGIAAYRAVELVRALQQAGFDPHVVMTKAAEQFVTPLTFAAISGHRVITSLWSGGEVPAETPDRQASAEGSDRIPSSVEHIEEAQTTQALIVVPATASVLARCAQGLADDFLTTLYLALPRERPVLFAPAMNVVMWQHPAVQANLKTLRERGDHIVEPGAGYLACGMQGSGRLSELSSIVDALQQALALRNPATTTPAADLSGETVLVTAGGTREPIDGVRFLGNRSSGRMGHALAEAALARGARVLLVTTAALPVPPGIEVLPVDTAAAMRDAVLARLPEATMVLKAAAVADYRPKTPFAGKLSRTGPGADLRTLELVATEDIVAEAVLRRRPGTFVVAFAAEVEDVVARAGEKMMRKGVDAIVVNDVSKPGIGFDSERNAAVMLLRTPDGERRVDLPESPKRVMAERILNAVMDQVSILRAGSIERS